jgi:hypothetical protein
MQLWMYVPSSLLGDFPNIDALRDLLSLPCAALLIAVLFGGCAQETSRPPDIRRDHQAISRILDAAMLSDHPTLEFRKALDTVRTFSSVDSAWADDTHFYVRYRGGGIVIWSAPTGLTNDPLH